MTASTFTRHITRLAALFFGAVLSAAIFAAPPGTYIVTNLVSDPLGPAAVHRDANLINGWGITFRATNPAWVSDNGTNKASIYDGLGTIIGAVSIPGSPTGVVGNISAADFGGAFFIFALENPGQVAAWSPPAAAATTVFTAPDGAVYKGLTIAGNGTALQLYLADFHNGKIDVLTSGFVKLPPVAGRFVDPTLPAGFHPFNILNLNGNLFVAYALKDPNSEDELHAPGLGFVNVFDPNGFLLARVGTRGKLNAPWGMALAPAGFGTFANHLLVGNFGDGAINAFQVTPYSFAGQLRSSTGGTLKIDGLWGIAFGNGVRNQPTNTLFFAAGPAEESQGLYGRIDAVPPAAQNEDDDDQD